MQHEVLSSHAAILAELPEAAHGPALESRPLPAQLHVLEPIPLPDCIDVGATDTGVVLKGLSPDRLWDVNITFFQDNNGVFVFCNGAGVMAGMCDQLADSVPVCGTVDLKRGFKEDKIADVLMMAFKGKPSMSALAINIVSGTARGRDALEGVSKFLEQIDKPPQILLRFEGPGKEELLSGFERISDRVQLFDSTQDLLTAAVASVPLTIPDTPASTAELRTRIGQAKLIRVGGGASIDPKSILSKASTLGEIFGLKRDTTIGVLGAGGVAQFQTKAMADLGNQISWICTPTASKHGYDLNGMPMFSSIQSAFEATGGVDVLVMYAPASAFEACVRDVLNNASNFKPKLIVAAAENLPSQLTEMLLADLTKEGIRFLGPNSPGAMFAEPGEETLGPDLYKLGNMPPHLFREAGSIGIVGRSGTTLENISGAWAGL